MYGWCRRMFCKINLKLFNHYIRRENSLPFSNFLWILEAKKLPLWVQCESIFFLQLRAERGVGVTRLHVEPTDHPTYAYIFIVPINVNKVTEKYRKRLTNDDQQCTWCAPNHLLASFVESPLFCGLVICAVLCNVGICCWLLHET